MVQKLAEGSFLHYQKYGLIELSEKGHVLGEYLLHRHEIIEELLDLLGVSEDILEETEKIEHNLSKETVDRINCLVSFFKEQPDIKEKYEEYKSTPSESS
jgi:Mn-dependent DtxR family transcriptional regulator